MVEEGTREVNGVRRRPDLGGEQMMLCADDVLESYTPGTSVVLSANVTAINSTKK